MQIMGLGHRCPTAGAVAATSFCSHDGALADNVVWFASVGIFTLPALRSSSMYDGVLRGLQVS